MVFQTAMSIHTKGHWEVLMNISENDPQDGFGPEYDVCQNGCFSTNFHMLNREHDDLTNISKGSVFREHMINTPQFVV